MPSNDDPPVSTDSDSVSAVDPSASTDSVPAADLPPGADPPATEAPRKRGGGPKTARGKRVSRRNALKKGLRAKVVFPDELAARIDQRSAEFAVEFRPRTPYEAYLVRDMALASVRIECCARESIVDLQRVIDHASVCWDADQQMIAEDLGAGLQHDPSRVALGLRSTRQGADWLITRWETLGAIATERGRWDDDQRGLAFDMLGIPSALREGTHWVPAADDPDGLARLARREIEKLRDDQAAVLDALDDASRAMARAAMPQTEDAVTTRLRRYERRLRRDLAKAHQELCRMRSGNNPSAHGRARSTMPASARPITPAMMGFHLRRHDAPKCYGDELQQCPEPANSTDAVAEQVRAVPDIAEESAAEPVVAAEPPAVVVKEAPAVAAEPDFQTMNRRQRKARQKRLRQAARRGASARKR